MTVLDAPAKLTWYLEVTGRRPNGYHELRSEMTTLALADRLTLDEVGDYVRVVDHVGRPVPEGEDNLVAAALALVGRRAGVVIDKLIPAGGGLGGGSADAAAILRWAGGVEASSALSLGGDVPFCQVGGRALVEGVGERVSSLAFEQRTVTLFIPDFGVSTPDCYRAYDELYGSGWRPTGTNHLEEPARRVEPRLATVLDWLRARFDDVRLAGSGSTMFVEGPIGDALDVSGPTMRLRVVTTTTTPAGA